MGVESSRHYDIGCFPFAGSGPWFDFMHGLLERISKLVWSLRRVLWVAMAVGHIPAFFGVWKTSLQSGFDGGKLEGCIGLTLAMLFFILKIVDVVFLRLRTSRRAWVAMGLVVALLHFEALAPDVGPAPIPKYATILATTLLVTRLPRLRRVVRFAAAGVFSLFKRHTPLAHSHETVWLDTRRPHCWLLASRVFFGRAPPA